MGLRLGKDFTFFVIIIDNRGLNARWCLTPFLLSLPTAAYLGQRGLTTFFVLLLISLLPLSVCLSLLVLLTPLICTALKQQTDLDVSGVCI